LKFVHGKGFVPDRPFQQILMFSGRDRSLSKCGVPERYSTKEIHPKFYKDVKTQIFFNWNLS
jgi:hypothetical protein